MSAGSVNFQRRQWAIAAVGAGVALALVMVLFRFPAVPETLAPPVPSTREAVRSGVQIAKPDDSDAILRDEAQVRDLRPLFLPTEHNVSLPEPRREPGRTFLDSETLKLGFAEAELSVDRDLPPISMLNGKSVSEARPVDLLAGGTDAQALQGFGRDAVRLAPLEPRGGFVQVIASASGIEVMAEPLGGDARPPGEKAWEPVEFLAAVDAAGLSAPLVITTSSRVEEVDAHFRSFLARRYRIGDRLPPGFYRIIVGP